MKTCPPLTSVVRRSDGFTQYQNTPGINKPSYHIRIPPHKTVRYIQQNPSILNIYTYQRGGRGEVGSEV